MNKNYVYRMWCRDTGKSYVGATTNKPSLRISNHRSLLESKKHQSKAMIDDWHKFGRDSFEWEVLWEGAEADLCQKESEFQAKFNCTNPNLGYNRLGATKIENSYKNEPLARFHGRYKGPETVVVSKRIRQEDVEEFKKILESVFVEGRVNGYFLGKKVESVVGHDVKTMKEDNWKLVEENAKLTKEVEMWKGKFERAVVATPDQLSSYWKRECLAAKAELARLSDVSQ